MSDHASEAGRANLDKIYNPKEIEDRIYQFWLDKKIFHADVNSSKQPYTIVIPPPNVTSQLHMGHAYNNTLQDILIRFYKARGFETEWMPGTDHAGIATQNVVEKALLKEEKKTRHDLGRDEFVRRVWLWKEKHGSAIINQLHKMGCACDWERTRFTMDEGLSRAVAEVFVRLYNKGLIYRGKYIINWCPRCLTALSDEEAEKHDTEGKIWYLKYPIFRTKKFVTVATTRPETMLGDVAVAVHPEDERYAKLIGKTLVLPIMNRKIPIVADEMVDREFGTGAVKITPAHDPNDFQLSQRHNLEAINVLNENATMNENAGEYQGLDRYEARKRVLEQLEREGLIDRVENHHHAVGRCQRCDTVVEPYLSNQWFVKMKPLAEPALQAAQEGKLKFHPERWTKVYCHWLENIRDWCISRQLWWGHQIPVWYHKTTGEMHCSVNGPSDPENWQRDSDVLDTWFSSWLWPFSTFGWPEQTPELKRFYPGDTLVTGPDIIFFWVARMVMAGYEFMGDLPFRDVYLNGIVRDEKGRKMSKSLGNGIDPLELIDKYSADAMRITVVSLSSEGADINFAKTACELGRNFTNKVWNSFRFLALHFDKEDLARATLANIQSASSNLELADRWILARLGFAIRKITIALEQFHFHEAMDALYNFFWKEYCDWYLELIKDRLNGEDQSAKRLALSVALYAMKATLKLLHPIAPFIAEHVWQELGREEAESIMRAAWPEPLAEFESSQHEGDFALLQDLIVAVRNIRGEMNIPSGKTVDVLIAGGNENEAALLARYESYFAHLARVQQLMYAREAARPKLAASAVVRNFEVFVPLAGLIDVAVERDRLQKEHARLEKLLEGLNQRLQSEVFTAKAPKDVVEKERQKKAEFESNLAKLANSLKQLSE